MTAPNRNRNHVLYVRLNGKEYADFEKKRSQTNMNKTDFLIRLLDKQEIRVFDVQPQMQELIYEFKKQGVNLNQIARALNQNPYQGEYQQLATIQSTQERLLNQIITLCHEIGDL